MLKSEVMSRSGSDSKFELSNIIKDLEDECYLKRGFNSVFNHDVILKIEEFSKWFNSVARLYLLQCSPKESELVIYHLLNLKRKIKYAISEINSSASNLRRSYTCNVCEEEIQVQPWQNLWSTLQEHPHFEETLAHISDFNNSEVSDDTENEESSMSDSIIDDLSEDLNQVSLDNLAKPPESSLNSFKFNFIIPYDTRIEEAFYPDTLITVARKKDKLPDYTVQRCGSGRGVCLLCPCSLIPRGRLYKVTPFLIKNHVSGQRHLKYASTHVNTNALKQYHEFWRGQDPNFQAHQVHFLPEAAALKCQLCLEFVSYGSVIEHIRDTSHKSKVVKIYNSPEGKLNEFYLLDMQVQIYEDFIKEVKKEDKQKEVKTDTNGIAPPKCAFIPFVVEPNCLNLPPRYNDHLKFFTKNSDSVVCNICNVNVASSIYSLKNHLLNPEHKGRSGFNSLRYSFFCEVCNTHIKDEHAWTEHFIKGPNRHETLPPGRKQKVSEWECKTCMTVIYGDELSLSRHMASRGGKSGRPKEIKLPLSIKKLFKSKNYIEDEARRIQNEATRVLDYQEKMKECCRDLERALAGLYPNCKAYPFGSRMSGLGNNQSDLDVFMDTGDMYLGNKQQDSTSQERFVKKASKLLKSVKEDFTHVVSIPSARTPIIKLHHNYTNLDCDISFRHALGVENTKFLRFCIDLQPITQSLILLLKRWSDYCKLNEHITNYSLALMAVFFLQTGGYLLSVKTVRNYNPTQSVVIDGWETLNYTVPLEKMKEFVKPYNAGIKQLLRGFFHYFSKFDYANQVVCPLLGSTVPKLLFNDKPNGEGLPPEMKSYVQRRQNENGEQFRGLTPFCIQDPFDLSHNLTKACPHGTINKLKALCTLTYEFFDTID